MGNPLKKIFIYSLLFLYGFVPILWFKPGRMIAGGEMSFYLNLDHLAQKNVLYTWSDKTSQVNNESAQATFYTPWLLLRELGFSSEMTQRIMWVITFMPIPFSMFYLFKSLNICKENILLGSLIASSLYTFNLFHALMSHGYALRFLYIFSPLIIGSYIKGLKEEHFRKKIRYSIYVVILSIGISVTASNPPTIVPILLVCFVFSVFYINKNNILKNMYYMLIIVCLGTLIHQFWLTQTYRVFSQTLNVVCAQDWNKLWNSVWEGSLYESFRLLGSWAFRNDIYNPWHIYYYGSFFNLTLPSYIIPLITFIFLLSKHKNKDILVFSIIALLTLFIMKGFNPPYGFVYKYFFGTFDWMYSFRSPWAKFGPALTLSYSIIAGYSSIKIFNYFYYRNKGILSYLCMVLILITILSVSFPMIIGKPSEQIVYKTLQSKEPLYWKELALWCKENDTSGRVLSFPNTNYTTIYNWKYGMLSCIPLAHNLIPNPHIHWAEDRFTTNYFQAISNFPYESFKRNNNMFNKYLNLLKVRYILQQNDVNYSHPDMVYHGIWRKFDVGNVLKSNENIVHIATFEKLDLYKIKKESSILEASF